MSWFLSLVDKGGDLYKFDEILSRNLEWGLSKSLLWGDERL